MGLDHILWAALLTNRSMKLTEPLVIARPSHGPRCRLVKALAGFQIVVCRPLQDRKADA